MNVPAKLEIGGFPTATAAANFVRALGFALKGRGATEGFVIGMRIAVGDTTLGRVVMLRKGVTLRFDVLAPGCAGFLPAILRQLSENG